MLSSDIFLVTNNTLVTKIFLDFKLVIMAVAENDEAITLLIKMIKSQL